MSGGARPGRASFEVDIASTIGLPIADDELTLGYSLRWSAARYSDREALVFEGRRWTYAELLAEAERCARALIAAGVRKGTHVGVLLGARPEFISLCYGVAMAGGVSVLISTFTGEEELDWILDHSDASLLFLHSGVRGREVAAQFVARHPSVKDNVPGELSDPTFPALRQVVVVSNEGLSAVPGTQVWEEFLGRADTTAPSLLRDRTREIGPADDAMLLYTSGSTSKPKAVLHMHRAPVMQGFRMADCMAIGPQDRTFTSFPVFWTAGWVTAVAAPLAVGATIVLQEFYDPAEALELIECERVTSVRQMIHDEMRLVAARDNEPRDLRSVTVGVVTESLRVLTSVSYDITEICGWGMTETFTNATMLPFDAPYDLRRSTMGRVVGGNAIRIRKPDSGDEQPAGELGEITVAGMSLMRGYYKAEPMLPVDAAGFLPTNDSGYVTPDGYLVFTGRLDRLIKTAGVNVSPIELEEHLQDWGRLGTCAVIGIPHPTLGAAVVLCAVRDGGNRGSLPPVSVEDVKDFLRGRVAAYKVPREVLFFDEEEMPLTISSKVQASEMTKLAVARLLETRIDAGWRVALTEQ